MTGLLDAFSGTVNADNPSTQVMSPMMAALLGASAGAGQYAGASRLPITNAQVIGGAAGGFLKGYQSGLAGIQAAQQAQMTRAQLGLLQQTPAFIRQAMGMMGGAAGGQQAPVPGGAAPAPQTFGGAPAGASGPAALGQAAAAGVRPGPTPYAASIQNSMTAGSPAASQIAPPGGAQAAPGVALGAQPPVAVQPLAPPSGTTQAAPSGVPQAAPQGDPQAALRRYEGMAALSGLIPQLKGLGTAATIAAQNDPGLATNLAQAKSVLSVDEANLAQAKASGNPDFVNAAQMKLMTDAGLVHVAGMTGTTTFLSPRGVQSSFNPQTGVMYNNGALSLVPGAVTTTQQRAQAEGAGEQAGKTAFTPIPTQIPSGPNAGQTNLTLGRNLFAGLGGPGVAAPGASAGSGAGAPGGVVKAVAPVTEEMSKSAGEQAGKNNEDFQTEAESAKDLNTQLDAIRNSAATFAPGKFANVRGEFLNVLNSTPGGQAFASAAFGKNWQQQLGSYQEGNKIAIQLQAAATRFLGSREAAQVFTWMGKSMPNLTMSGQGLEKVSSFMEGMNNYKIARAQIAQQRFNQNDAVGVNNVRNAFLQNSNPMYFIMAASSPADRVEYLRNMGPAKARQFLSMWSKADAGGWAPGPQ